MTVQASMVSGPPECTPTNRQGSSGRLRNRQTPGESNGPSAYSRYRTAAPSVSDRTVQPLARLVHGRRSRLDDSRPWRWRSCESRLDGLWPMSCLQSRRLCPGRRFSGVVFLPVTFVLVLRAVVAWLPFPASPLCRCLSGFALDQANLQAIIRILNNHFGLFAPRFDLSRLFRQIVSTPPGWRHSKPALELRSEYSGFGETSNSPISVRLNCGSCRQLIASSDLTLSSCAWKLVCSPCSLRWKERWLKPMH